MIAAGVQNTGPLGSITGVAPKAFLGNYKVFGSPGVNEYTYRSAWIQALTDAVADRMDIVTLSLGEGDPAFFGPLDTGVGVCGDPVCDVGAQAVENATSLGTLVVAAAGNGGNIGFHSVTHDAVNSPGTAPSAITVGASANSHLVYQTVRVNGSSLGNLRGLLGDGPRIASPLTAPVKDVTKLGDDGLGCAALPAASLTGAFALIQRGTCYFSNKINFAQAAGAIGAILYQAEGIDDVTTRLYVQDTGIPSAIIGNGDGKALKTYLGTNPNATVTLDPAYATADNPQVNTVAAFSGRGPSVGNFAATRDFALKPELVAPGTNIYTATQKFDPNADTYNATGYTTVNGTSYAVPFVAGVAAMAKARNSNLNTPGRLKSAVVNTASADLLGDYPRDRCGRRQTQCRRCGERGRHAGTGGDLVRAHHHAAGQSHADPDQREQRGRHVFDQGAATDQRFQCAGDGEPEQRHLAGGAEQPAITVSLTGSKPAPGSYEGFLDVKSAAGPDLHLPYFYVVGNGVPYDIFPLQNGSFAGIPNDFGYRLSFRIVDSYGVPVANYPVSFQILAGGGKFNSAGGDKLRTGVGDGAGVFVDLGPQQGDQIFTGTVAGLTQEFEGYARRRPPSAAAAWSTPPPSTRWGRAWRRDRTFRFSAAIFPIPPWWRARSRCRCRWGRFR